VATDTFWTATVHLAPGPMEGGLLFASFPPIARIPSLLSRFPLVHASDYCLQMNSLIKFCCSHIAGTQKKSNLLGWVRPAGLRLSEGRADSSRQDKAGGHLQLLATTAGQGGRRWHLPPSLQRVIKFQAQLLRAHWPRRFQKLLK
jgi:hypothetical protein